ncbi:MAG: hypothetical protein FVQ77_08850 [Cytophagales bacterium]|nr:hypothetical protein [Cytophagales bacterium]
MNDIIEQNKTKVSKNRNIYEKNEAAVRMHLIDPVLNQLGWTTDFVIPNSPTDEKDIPDYTLRTNDKDIAYIEAKKISPKLKDHIGQLARYCTNQGKQYGILTDGMKWILFKAFEEDTKLHDRIIWEIDFEKDSTAEIEARLNTISFSNFPKLKTLSDKRDKLITAWDNIVSNPNRLKETFIEFLNSDLENSEHTYEFAEIEKFVTGKLQESSRLFTTPEKSSTDNNSEKTGYQSRKTIPKENHPKYFAAYKKQLENPNNLINKMLNYIQEEKIVTWGELKKKCVSHFGCTNELSGSIGANLKTLERVGEIKINGHGDNKKISINE